MITKNRYSQTLETEADDYGIQTLIRTKYYADTTCLLYTSDAADERSSVDLGGRRIIKKKKQKNITCNTTSNKKTKLNQENMKKKWNKEKKIKTTT